MNATFMCHFQVMKLKSPSSLLDSAVGKIPSWLIVVGAAVVSVGSVDCLGVVAVALITRWSLNFLGFRSLLVSRQDGRLGMCSFLFLMGCSLLQVSSHDFFPLLYDADELLSRCWLVCCASRCEVWLSPLRSCAEELLPRYLPARPLRASVRDCMYICICTSPNAEELWCLPIAFGIGFLAIEDAELVLPLWHVAVHSYGRSSDTMQETLTHLLCNQMWNGSLVTCIIEDSKTNRSHTHQALAGCIPKICIKAN